MSAETKTVPLYRVENPTIPARLDGVTSHEDLVGQWFSPNLNTATAYLRKSTQTFGKDNRVVDGAQLVVAEVPEDQLEMLHVLKHPVASTMDVEGDNYIVPRDGSVPMITIPLDETLGDLRGSLGNVEHLLEARRRVGELMLSQTSSK